MGIAVTVFPRALHTSTQNPDLQLGHPSGDAGPHTKYHLLRGA